MMGKIISEVLMEVMAFLIDGLLLVFLLIALISLVDKIKEMVK